MTQPKYAPILEHSSVRKLRKLPAPSPWHPHRPGDFVPGPASDRRPGRGVAGPDQGYAMLLAEGFAERVRLSDDEHCEDVLYGAAVIGLCRAALFGRAPVVGDIELALSLFGFLDGAPDEVIEARGPLFLGVSHDYWLARELADLVPQSTLRSTAAAISSKLSENPATFGELVGLSA